VAGSVLVPAPTVRMEGGARPTPTPPTPPYRAR
jgi:hypothetical protein